MRPHYLPIYVWGLWSTANAQTTSPDSQIQEALDGITVTNVEDVRGNLHLPDLSGGLNVTWESSKPSIIATDGIVKRQDAETAVNLTAIISHDGATANRTFNANVRKAVELEPFEGYAFTYFTNNSLAGEKIYLAASQGNDALDWKELNDGQPILTSTEGTKGLRDPFVIRSPEGDVFYLLATDLSIGSGTSWGDAVRIGSLYLEIWESSDLKRWSQQRHVKVSPDTAGNTWAPEAYYDTDLGSYVVFWASSLYEESDTNRTGSTYHRMLYVTTRDFVTFSEPEIWQDAGMSRIDTTVIQEGNTFFRFTKDEGGTGTNCTDIIQERSSSLLAPVDSWTQVAACIGRNAGTSNVEGPTVFKANEGDINGEKYYLFVDEYTGRGYIPLETADIANPDWKVSSSYNLPSSPRHGTVIPVTAQELAGLNAETGSPVLPGIPVTSRELAGLNTETGSPVLPGLYADPNIAVFGDHYYIYATTDGYPGWNGNVFYVWKSPDLVSWTRADEPFLTLNGTDGNVPWATGNAWAPTIIERDGKYYFYFSGQNPAYDRKTIGVAIAEAPEGPFTAQPTAMILNNGNVTTGQAIDPATFEDPTTGKYYIFWGNGDGSSAALYAELTDDMVAIKNGTTRSISGLDDFREGIFMNYREGLFHLTYSIDDTRSENYRVGYATSLSVHGPWTYHGVILQKNVELGILGTGHSSIINVPNTDDWYMAYHRFAIPNGNGTMREVTIDRVYFDDEGLIKPVVPTLESVQPETIPA
ncbi:glycoside hydrolase family 43 protein [Stemphylium lycopersici]|uniref:Endo-1,5-alpha-L-arabinanase A n=1 Tax=Stemphylium lycopersici TaxID=183478 RepID=A0A364NGB9_STELY|nr:glycoside hydrolase family 43 protein [Stemphylium lycopersici]RAR03690.1 glycoside hydrolase family 43 protein [Stemphylium lycopersici]RAR16141.1 glycoside hydrolase family 43 protein [Stemphylium lycopersici]